jgi:hypothetical protein
MAFPFFLPGGLSRVCEVVNDEDFEIIINEHKYSLPLVEAVFVSPRILSLLKMDSTIR